jgi:outer membrane immunogenic protein
MKKFWLGTIGLVALGMAGPAMAADLPAGTYTKAPPPMIPAAYDWSGFYTGFNGGWGSSHKCWDALLPSGALIGSEGCHDATGGVGGGQVGYRWQTSSWVFGVEGQGDWADLRGSNTSVLFPAFINNSKVDAFGLFTGQIGYAWNTVLAYVKGGAAATADRFSVSTNASNVVAGVTGDQTRWGGTVGAGLEFAFAPNWSAAVEYDHLFMQDKSTTFTDPVTGSLFGSDRIRQDVDLVTVRVNYRWGGPTIPKY